MDELTAQELSSLLASFLPDRDIGSGKGGRRGKPRWEEAAAVGGWL